MKTTNEQRTYEEENSYDSDFSLDDPNDFLEDSDEGSEEVRIFSRNRGDERDLDAHFGKSRRAVEDFLDKKHLRDTLDYLGEEDNEIDRL